jgi:hypothetical protein
MLSRKNQEKPGVALPLKWCDQASATLYSTYESFIDEQDRQFQFHGFTYPDEVLMAASLISHTNEFDIPITYMVSVDLHEDQQTEKLLGLLLDSMGIFFDNYFQDQDGSHYEANWTEAEFQKQTFHYKVTRENVALSIKAEQLLNQ